jgi:hypothetical protein
MKWIFGQLKIPSNYEKWGSTLFVIRLGAAVKNNSIRTCYRKTWKLVLLCYLRALNLGSSQMLDMPVLHKWNHEMECTFLFENGGTVFLQKDEAVVKWVMRFVLFRIPVSNFLLPFIVRLELSPVCFLFSFLSFQIGTNVGSAGLVPGD